MGSVSIGARTVMVDEAIRAMLVQIGGLRFQEDQGFFVRGSRRGRAVIPEMVPKKQYSLARVIWCLATGAFPDEQARVAYRDGDRTNLTQANLFLRVPQRVKSTVVPEVVPGEGSVPTVVERVVSVQIGTRTVTVDGTVHALLVRIAALRFRKGQGFFVRGSDKGRAVIPEMVPGKEYSLARVIWRLVTGAFPDEQARVSLRDKTRTNFTQANLFLKMPKRGELVLPEGVPSRAGLFLRPSGRYGIRVPHPTAGKTTRLRGSFATPQEAIRAKAAFVQQEAVFTQQSREAVAVSARKAYSEGFKRGAVALLGRSAGRPARIAEVLQVPLPTLLSWQRQFTVPSGPLPDRAWPPHVPELLSVPAEDLEVQYQQDIERLTKECQVLRKAIGRYAQEYIAAGRLISVDSEEGSLNHTFEVLIPGAEVAS